MWEKGWREHIWAALDEPWDVLIVGGGITGAGILREAVRSGLRALLVEQGDFASGTSSRSSKLVHGGFRYLKNGQVRLTLEAVRERERLLKEGRGLVNPLGFLMPCYRGDALPGWMIGAGLIAYDLLAWQWGHRRYDAYDMQALCPSISPEGLSGGYRFFDAQTDDARLVLRLLQESAAAGGVALNYTHAAGLLRDSTGRVRGAALVDLAPGAAGRSGEVQAGLVINAAGAWVDELRSSHLNRNRGRLRKLRGSHLIFPSARLPVTRAVSFVHPRDGRPVFALPWEGVTLFGTTDVDHPASPDEEPAISPDETAYLLSAVQQVFPCLALSASDVQATFAGVRPVVATGQSDPSKESREHVLWYENGLLTVAGGKLTTFRLMARAALQQALRRLPHFSRARSDRNRPGRAPGLPSSDPIFDPPPTDAASDALPARPQRLRLLGRYGAATAALLAAARPGELEPVGASPALWAELRWAARAEGVIHLDDLLLRRVRLGLLLPQGGLPWIEQIRSIVQTELGWDDPRWGLELESYTNLWKRCYHLPV